MTYRDVHKTEYLIYADLIRIFSVVGVVFLHVAGVIQQLYSNIGSCGWWVANIGDSASRWAVPSLIMLAGALHLDDKKVEPAAVFLVKRIKRIAVPLVGWFLIYFLWAYLWRGQSINLRFVVKRIVLGGPYYHLYFFYIIGSLYLITPFLRLHIRCASLVRGTKLIITFLFLGFLDSFFFYLLYHRVGWYDSISSFFPLFVLTFGYVGYFLAGYQLRTMTVSRKTFYFALGGLLLSFVATSVGTYIFTSRFGIFSFGPYLCDSFSPTCIAMSLCIFIVLKEERSLAGWVGKNEKIYHFVKERFAPGTFGIYLIHPIFLDIFLKYINMTGNQDGALISVPPWLGIFLLSGVVLLFSFIATSLIQRVPFVKRMVGYW